MQSLPLRGPGAYERPSWSSYLLIFKSSYLFVTWQYTQVFRIDYHGKGRKPDVLRIASPKAILTNRLMYEMTKHEKRRKPEDIMYDFQQNSEEIHSLRNTF
eukprot:5770811-Pyramimonas_sp.AAC.1